MSLAKMSVIIHLAGCHSTTVCLYLFILGNTKGDDLKNLHVSFILYFPCNERGWRLVMSNSKMSKYIYTSVLFLKSSLAITLCLNRIETSKQLLSKNLTAQLSTSHHSLRCIERTDIPLQMTHFK